VTDLVVDASALLALLSQEGKAERRPVVLKDATMSAVNLSEVVAKLAEAGMPEAEIRSALDPLGLEVVAFDAGQAYLAGLLRPQTKAVGLSLGDRACLALAQKRGSPVLTMDRAWARLQIGVEVRLMR
jgi:ribonuclease VapC